MLIKMNISHRLFKFKMTMIAVFISTATIFAQNVEVTGTVSDSNGEPIIGANVIIKGTTKGVSTDINGKYQISVSSNATLEFKSIGYKDASVPVNGKKVINITLDDDSVLLNEAVITAEFGMKRVSRAVGSAVQNVKATDITESGRESFVSALQGRVAGMSVTSSGGAPGASTSVILRSVTSISGNNQPLYVVDGVPMNNSTVDPVSGFAKDNVADSRDLDFASRGNDINPDDIETMTILKGAAAAALYGSDASNGAIIITTKKGKPGKGKVSYSNSFRWDKAYGYPEIQTVYGNGAYGVTNYYNTGRFGGKYSDATQLFNNINSLLQTGFSQNHNLSVEGGTEKVTLRAAAEFIDQKGVVKTTDYNRLNLSLSGTAQVTKWLDFNATLAYTKSDNHKAKKGTDGPLYRASRWPLTDNMLDYIAADGSMRTPNLYTDTDLMNPLYALYKNINYDEVNRMRVSLGLKITPTKHTFIRAQFGWDSSDQKMQYHTHPYYSNPSKSGYGEGSYNLSKMNLNDNTLNVFAGYDNEWGKFTFQAMVGYHQQENKIDNLRTYGSKFQVIDFYSISNCDPSTIVTNTRTTNRRVQAVSASATIGYNNLAFLTAKARNDWSSTLPKANRSYFYPAVEGSVVLSEINAIKNTDAISYFKLRGAIARVGKDANPLAIYPSLETTNDLGGGYKYGFYGPNEALKPEMTTSYELGAEARFLNDRINADFTYYWTKCEDQYITGFRLSYATGFVLNNMNVGTFTTRGWDLHIDGDILRTRSGVRWNVGLNLDASTSEVTELPNNVKEYYNAYTWVSGNLRNGISVGNPITSITGKAYQRNEKGDILINPSTGLPLIDDKWSVLGDRNPKLNIGITSSLSYKGFRLSMLFSGKLGASVVNGTKRDMMGTGSSWESVTLRESDPVVFNGVLKNGLENSSNPTINTIGVTYANYGSSIYTGGDEDWFEKDVNYLRCQEIRLGYIVPSRWLERVTKKFVSNASIYFKATDLFTVTNYSGIDPVGNSNSAALGGSGGVGIDFWSVPNPRGYAFGISLTF